MHFGVVELLFADEGCVDPFPVIDCVGQGVDRAVVAREERFDVLRCGVGVLVNDGAEEGVKMLSGLKLGFGPRNPSVT